MFRQRLLDRRTLDDIEIQRRSSALSRPLYGGLHGLDQLFVAPGLEDEIHSAALERLHCERHATVRSHQHDRQRRVMLKDASEPIETFATTALASNEVHV